MTFITNNISTSGFTGSTLFVENYIDMGIDVNPKPLYEEGRVFYDYSEHTLSLYNSSSAVTHQLGQEGLIRVYNDSGALINDGMVVKVTGSEVTEDRPTIDLAKADVRANSNVIGVTTEPIPNNSFGFITEWGMVNDLNLNGFIPGTSVYLSATVGGGLQSMLPSEGEITIHVGTVVKSGTTDGKLLVDLSDNGALTDFGLISNVLGTVWATGLLVTENSPTPDQTVDYTSGTYYINGVLKTISSGGNLDLMSSFTGLSSNEKMVVGVYVDVDETLKTIDGAPTASNANLELPNIPINSVCIAYVTVRNQGGSNVDVENIDIGDCRGSIGGNTFGTDEFVKVSGDDDVTGYLSTKITGGTNITLTVLNSGANELLEISATGGAGENNTASNVGGGTGVFSGKSGVDLQFKSLTSTGATVSIIDKGSTINLESTAGGGDYANGGEAGGANRTLGNTDAYSLAIKTNNIDRLTIGSGGTVTIGDTTTNQSTNLYIRSKEDATLWIQGDSDNFSEADNPEIILQQDGNSGTPTLGRIFLGDNAYGYSNDLVIATGNKIDSQDNLANIVFVVDQSYTLNTDAPPTFVGGSGVEAINIVCPTGEVIINKDLSLNNPAETFKYTISRSAITANRTVTLPLLTGNDTFVTQAFAQTLTNKTLTSPVINTQISGTITNGGNITTSNQLVGRTATQTLTNKTVSSTSNSITSTSQAIGDLLKNNGSKYVRFAKGSPLQVLRVNAGGTDLEWAAPAGGSGNSDMVVTTVALAGGPTNHNAVETANRIDLILVSSFDDGDDITLPASPTTGHVFHIKDGSGTAKTTGGGKRINVLGNGKNIDGVSSRDIDIAYQNMALVYNGTQWNRI